MPVLHSLVDIANAPLEFGDGSVATVNTSRVSSQTQRKFRIYTPEGYVSLDFLNQTATLASKAGSNIQTNTVTLQVDCLEQQADEFLRCVRDLALQPLVSGRQALEALEWTERIQAAVRERNLLLSSVRAGDESAWQPKFS